MHAILGLAVSLLSTTLLCGTALAAGQPRLPVSPVPVSPSAAPAASVLRGVAYGPHARQRYDIHLPALRGPGAPILVIVHGGGWRTGDKARPDVIDRKAAHWLAKGYVVVSTNYRLVPDADALAQAEDVAAAVASVQRMAARLDADPRRLVLLGHSAGAHLVALLAASPTLLHEAGAIHAPLGAVALDSAALDVPAAMRSGRTPVILRQAFGRDPAGWTAASPRHRLAADALPMLLVCSRRRAESCAQARTFAGNAERLGIRMHVMPVDLSHGSLNATLGRPGPYTREVAAWIDDLAE